MIKLEIKSIRIESTNKNHRPVLRKKTLREEYNELITLYTQGEGTREQLVERLMDRAVKSMTLVPDGKYSRSREELAWRFKESYTGDEPMTGRLHVLIIIDTYKDADNFKIICDALQDAGVIKNDREVIYYAVAKTVVKRGSNEKITVQIYNESENYKQKELGFDTPLSSKISVLDRQPEKKS